MKHIDRECFRCNTELVIPDNYRECCLKKKYYICNQCDSIKRKINTLKKKAAQGEDVLASLATIKAIDEYNRIPNGYIYAITNPAFKGWVKVGLAANVDDRLRGYQTASPFRDYKVEVSLKVKDRHRIEKLCHKALGELYPQSYEWFQCDVAEVQNIMQGVVNENS